MAAGDDGGSEKIVGCQTQLHPLLEVAAAENERRRRCFQLLRVVSSSSTFCSHTPPPSLFKAHAQKSAQRVVLLKIDPNTKMFSESAQRVLLKIDSNTQNVSKFFFTFPKT